MTIFIQSDYKATTSTLSAGDGLVVARSSTIQTVSASTNAIVGIGANAITVQGTVTASGLGSHGIYLGGANNTIVLESTGVVYGAGYGIDFEGSGNTLVNSGLVFGGTEGLFFFGTGISNIFNYGTIFSPGSDGILSFQQINLLNYGTIQSPGDGIDATQSPTGTNIINNGTIIGGADNSLDLSNAGDDAVVNNGLLQSPRGAFLNGGNDYFDGRNGIQAGGVFGGTGNDTIYGGAQADLLSGGAGVDSLYGGGGADTINGGSEGDLIAGGAGADVLTGDLGGDLFVFNVGDNGDLIKAFNEGGVRDGFDLRGYFDATGFTGADPRAAGIMQVLQNGADTDVFLHGAFAFRIEGVVAAAIDNSYFLIQ